MLNTFKEYLYIMVKKILILVSFILLESCCYSGSVSTHGLPRKKINTLRNFNYNRKIDTLTVYRLIYRAVYDKERDRYTHYLLDDYRYTSFLKFYANGKLGLFIVKDDDLDKLNREIFNPSKAKMGYYSYRNNSLITRTSITGDCNLQIINQVGSIAGDTIFLYTKNNYHAEIYAKEKINAEFLKNWKPDW